MEGNKKETRGLAQAEDLALKSAAAYFGEEIIPWLGIRKRMRRVAPTELVRLETRDAKAAERLSQLGYGGDFVYSPPCPEEGEAAYE